jgi:hypothetical protein
VDICREGQLPFQPLNYFKPAFHTYFTYFLSRAPIEIIGKIFDLPDKQVLTAILIWSRLITAFLFAGTVIVSFMILQKHFGLLAARVTAVLLGTSAGFIAFAHLLTVDIPVVFWMMVAFLYSTRIASSGRWIDYLLAGLFTGVATGTKYNGLAVGISIVIAHLLLLERITWRRLLFDIKLIAGLSMVIIGFVVTNPFVIIDWSKFRGDFIYNYIVTPVYSGVMEGRNYIDFFVRFTEFFGYPVLCVTIAGVIYSSYRLFSKKTEVIERRGIILLASVFAIYYLFFGNFPRLPTRFVMPAAVIWLMMAAPLWPKLRQMPFVAGGLLIALVGYNAVSSAFVGKRFTDDPRMGAVVWIRTNIPAGSSIERSIYTPSLWFVWGDLLLEVETSPFISGRTRLFADVLRDQKRIEPALQLQAEEEARKILWYSPEALQKRSPDYLLIGSLYYGRFLGSKSLKKNYYPELTEYFQNLIKGNSDYTVIYDHSTENPPWWLYPREIDFLANRQIILKRRS